MPPGYSARVLVAWDDPVSNRPQFKQDASNSAADQAQQWGMHNDSLVYFPIRASTHGLLVQNNEYTDDGLLFPDGIANWNEEKTNKSINAIGIAIVEIMYQGRSEAVRGDGRLRHSRRTYYVRRHPTPRRDPRRDG
jgi:uncharacterized protein